MHTLGNLTITGHNSELGTKSFSEKKKIIKENSKASILNKEVLSADRWNEDSILNRARILADMLIKEFEYVDIHSGTESNTGLSFTINSGIDFTDTKPDGFSFVGEYTKALFQATDYPAIANDRSDNMGNSTQKRYRAMILSFLGAKAKNASMFYEVIKRENKDVIEIERPFYALGNLRLRLLYAADLCKKVLVVRNSGMKISNIPSLPRSISYLQQKLMWISKKNKMN